MREYDNELINNNIENFKNLSLKPNDVDIYFDMDNTLCLFSPFGDVESSCRVMYQKGFYRELLCFPEAPSVLYNLQGIGFNVKILSSCIDSPYCRPEKLSWINYHLPFVEDKNILLLPVGQSKSNLIPNPERSILVDDYHANITDIYKHGGIGVKKTFSGKERPIPQVSSLVDIFSVLHNLNCL
ncbi:5' nucleotidase, NT5C type [Sinanaerobacter sp. ZZT-01]|uniref:5' nucleotidase, NT5C type n=1 Tax=Sinanaerobacter sp. ZZT-01 TaxID=3111540 RepID=UPI002D776AC0|nr:hypothetical protein [Sinanaerobacter sp. ZZT-01]WRR92707.1 hypothetical protein U5921_11720 [Sinanaerobacter sp. ZZT-01]